MNDYLVEIRNNGDSWNFIFNESGPTNKYAPASLKVTRIPADISKIKSFYRDYLYYDSNDNPNYSELLVGLQMWDREGKLVFDSGCEKLKNGREIELAEGERIVGIKSHTYDEQLAQHALFSFVLGRME
jgi:hypothetical protein